MKGSGLGFIRVIIGIFLIVAVVVIGNQIYQHNFVSIRTEDAIMGEMEQTIKGAGIFFRDEMILDNDGFSYLDVIRTEGERVSANGVVARVYSNEETAKIQKDIREIEKKIDTYEEVLSHSGKNENAEGGIIKEISQNISSISDYAQKGHSGLAFSSSDELIINIMKQKIAAGDLVSYDSILDGLKLELSDLRSRSEGSMKTINSEQSGYFSLHTDGLETQLNKAALSEINVDNFDQTMKLCQDGVKKEDAVGKMVYGNSWSVALQVRAQDIHFLEVNQSVYIRIPSHNDERIKCTVADIRKNGDKAVIILSSSVIDANILTLRCDEIQLILKTYSGIRVRHSALRKVDGEDGVFVKVGLLLRYKKVNVLFNDGDHAIIEYKAVDETGIRVHDQVVYKGSKLYDGKAVS